MQKKTYYSKKLDEQIDWCFQKDGTFEFSNIFYFILLFGFKSSTNLTGGALSLLTYWLLMLQIKLG